MAQTEPILDLTVVDPHVLINGASYTLRVRDDLSILTNAENAKRFERIEALRVKQRTKKEDTELVGLLEQACGVVLSAPASVIATLSQFQKLSVVTAFFTQIAVANPRSSRRDKLEPKPKSNRSTSAN